MGLVYLATLSVTFVLGQELWTGAAFLPWQLSGGTRSSTGAKRPVVRRTENPLGYWVMIAFHTAIVSFSWWYVVTHSHDK